VPLVRLLSKEEAAPEAREMLDSGEQQYGMLLGTWRAMANRPEIFAAYLPFLRAVAGPAELEQRLKDLSALKTAMVNRCRYTVSHRLRAAKAVGVTDAEAVALARDELDGFSGDERLAIELTRQLTLAPADTPWSETPTAVDPVLLEQLRRRFSDAQLVELTISIAVWNMLARFHRAMGLELDMPAAPEEIERHL
jgi:AhpD family alkylhydroperoxidase